MHYQKRSQQYAEEKNTFLRCEDLRVSLDLNMNESLRKKCPYSEFFWSVFSRIQTEYGEIQIIQSECGKIWTRKTPNTDTFHAINFKAQILQKIFLVSDVYLELSSTSTMEFFCRNVLLQMFDWVLHTCLRVTFNISCIQLYSHTVFNPVDTGRKLNVYKTFRRHPRRLLNVLCTFNLRLVSTGNSTSEV